MLADLKTQTSVRALLSELIDYAGLFPPAALDMRSAWQNYSKYREGPYRWALGRFVVPASRLGELGAIATSATTDSRLSVLIGNDVEQDLVAAVAAGADTVELKASTVTQIRKAADRIPAGLTTYFEVPIDGDPAPLLEAIADVGGRAKVRTGGLTPDLFPGSRDLAQFIQACSDEHVAFKATAGLHHPVRGLHKLTYAADSAAVVMHGFLNVFLASALLRAGEERHKIRQVLEDESANSFQFENGTAKWKDHTLDIEQILDARRNLAIGFGSCSFEEPIADLKELGML